MSCFFGEDEWHATDPTGYRLIVTETHRSGGSEALHPYLRRFEEAVLEVRGCSVQARSWAEGWEPDLVTFRGFGNGLYIRDAFPKARRLVFLSGFITAPT